MPLDDDRILYGLELYGWLMLYSREYAFEALIKYVKLSHSFWNRTFWNVHFCKLF